MRNLRYDRGIMDHLMNSEIIPMYIEDIIQLILKQAVFDQNPASAANKMQSIRVSGNHSS